MFRYFVGRIQKGFSLFGPRRPAFSYFSEDSATTSSASADDAMEGYFAVVAIEGEETKRFIIGLEYLNDPAFLELLEQAREEYGFTQQGVLSLPCRPQELLKILDAPKAKSKEYHRRRKEYRSSSASRSNH